MKCYIHWGNNVYNKLSMLGTIPYSGLITFHPTLDTVESYTENFNKVPFLSHLHMKYRTNKGNRIYALSSKKLM